MSQSRKLAAIMFTDIVGYTALMGNDEQKAFELLKKNRELQKPIIEQFNGRWIKELGDGVMASFNTVSDAVNAAIKIQEACNAAKDFQLRIGIHLGEVVFENDDVFGDGVNIASRIQTIANPGSIYVSESVHNNVSNKKDFQTKFIKEEKLKNVKEAMRIYQVIAEGIVVVPSTTIVQKIKTKKSVLLFFETVVILSTAGYFIKDIFTTQRSNQKSIAVLPFTDLSEEQNQEYFSDGMMVDIINRLSKIEDLQVISRTSCMKYKGTKITLKEIANELGVSNLLEGSIQKLGNRIRISVTLTNGKNSKNLWAEEYDRDLTDIFAVQSDVSKRIAEILKTKLTQQEKLMLLKSDTKNPEAYKFYLKGRFFWDIRSRESFDSAEVNFLHAVQLDPQYALAYSGLADCYIFNKKGLSQLDATPIAKAYATKALSLDSTLAEAWTTIAFIKLGFDFDWKGAKLDFEKAIQLNPNYAVARQFYGGMLVWQGEKNSGLLELKRAIELDPLSLAIHWFLALNYYYARDYNNSLLEFQKTLTINPKYELALRGIGDTYLAMGNYNKAIDQLEQLSAIPNVADRTNLLLDISYAYALSGNMVKARQVKDQAMENKLLNSNYFLAKICVAEKKYEEAINNLSKAYSLKEFYVRFMKVDPAFDPIRNDNRFKLILKKIWPD